MNPTQGANSPAPNQLPRLLRQDITRWANVHGIYPADAAKQAFEDAATSDYAKAVAHAEQAQLVARVASLEGALRDANGGLAVARAALKTAHHCMNSAEYSAAETKFQNARDLVYTAFVGVSATEDRSRALLSPVPQEGQKATHSQT